jgi:hypothetical protein
MSSLETLRPTSVDEHASQALTVGVCFGSLSIEITDITSAEDVRQFWLGYAIGGAAGVIVLLFELLFILWVFP